MYIYLITTYKPDGTVRARISFTCDESDMQTAKALVTLDDKATIVLV